MVKQSASKGFFFLSLGVVGYFCLLSLNNYVIKSTFVLIGVFQEMLTLPLLFLVQPILLVLSVKYCIKDKFRIKTYSFWSFVILLVSNSFLIGSFVLSKIN
jgi:hypothetical protein